MFKFLNQNFFKIIAIGFQHKSQWVVWKNETVQKHLLRIRAKFFRDQFRSEVG